MSNGTSYLGSEEKKISVANEEIIPRTPEGWTADRYKFIQFAIRVYQDCTLIVNNESKIPLDEGEMFTMDSSIPPITSIKIAESGISYKWAGIH